MLNDPFRGGTHLPDITLVAPVFVQRRSRQAPEAHRARLLRSARARTMPTSAAPTPVPWACAAKSTRKAFRIPPVKLVRAGELHRDILALLLNNVRTPEEREGDLGAQLAACHTGAARLRELCARYGR